MSVTANDPARANLTRAQDLRLERAELLRALRAKQLCPVWLIREPPECIQGMFTFDFLREIPRMGPHRVRRLNAAAIRDQVNLVSKLGELTPLKREWLANELATNHRMFTGGRWPIATKPQG